MAGKGIVLFSLLVLVSDVASVLVNPLPQNKAVQRGTTNVAFSCNSTYGLSFITWSFLSSSNLIASGSAVIPGYGDTYSISQSGNSVSTLTVITVSESLAGTYFCNEGGASATAQLIVYNSDPVATSNVSSGKDLIQGQSVEMSCSFSYTANYSNVGVNMVWSKVNPSSIVQNTTVSPTDGRAVLTITPTVGYSSPFPVHQCQTSFKVTGTTAANVPDYTYIAQPFNSSINVSYFNPNCSIKGATSGQNVPVGTLISCEVDARPSPSYRWSNGTNATLSSDSSVAIMNDGEYTCTAWNSVGGCTQSITNLKAYSTPAPSTTGGGLTDTEKIIVGVVVGVGGFLLIVAIIIIICCCKKKNKSGAKYENGNTKPVTDYPPPYDGHVGPQRDPRPDSVNYSSADRQYQNPSRSSYVSNSPTQPHIGDDGLNYAQIQLDNQPRSRQPLQMPEGTSNYVEIALA